jgi:hypothetical protein
MDAVRVVSCPGVFAIRPRAFQAVAVRAMAVVDEFTNPSGPTEIVVVQSAM